MGGKFLKVDFEEDGTGTGGYAKEMSNEYKAAEAAMLAKAASDSDIIIATALIPGRPAPKLITKEAVLKMRAGSVTVDLAAETGGNIGTTVERERPFAYGTFAYGTFAYGTLFQLNSFR